MYSYPQNSEHYEPSSLLFIHQSFEQVQILKWYNISLYNIFKHYGGIIHAQISILKILYCRYPRLVLMDATYKTCKLALPLFFLVVKTNVGYSVIAKFVIQHEGMKSIAEALGILKERWDREGVWVANFMINCQQSEENAMWGVLPETGVYLCGFHRLQAWLRWLVNTKNGVSGHKDQVLGLLWNIVKATTKDKYMTDLLRLQKLHIWSKHVKLRSYYTQQWAPKKLVRNLVY